jgi:hypothetical protein
MKRRLLLVLPALQQLDNYKFRLVKYSRFPPLSLLTLAGLTPDDRWEVIARDEHIESSEVAGPVDLVGIQTYISSSGRAYELADRWRRRGAKVVLGGLHPTSLPDQAEPHADAVCTGPAETVWRQVLDDFEHGRLQKRYHGRRQGSAALAPVPRRDLMNPRGYLIRNTMVTSRGCPHACDFCYETPAHVSELLTVFLWSVAPCPATWLGPLGGGQRPPPLQTPPVSGQLLRAVRTYVEQSSGPASYRAKYRERIRQVCVRRRRFAKPRAFRQVTGCQ